jgi:hypothetical protein
VSLYTLQRFLSIFLFCAILLQVSFKLLIYFDYEINKEYITLRYCENISKPEMKCEGKCHLAKKIQESEEKEIPPSGKDFQEILLFSEPFASGLPELPATTANQLRSGTPPPVTAPAFPIFHPPCRFV